MAELLEMLSSEYDFPQLVDSILRDVASKEFDEAIKDLSAPRAYSKFLVKLSEIAPKSVLKQMGLLIQHLDGEVRCQGVAGVDDFTDTSTRVKISN
jgi:condensin complex subunit 1